LDVTGWLCGLLLQTHPYSPVLLSLPSTSTRGGPARTKNRSGAPSAAVAHQRHRMQLTSIQQKASAALPRQKQQQGEPWAVIRSSLCVSPNACMQPLSEPVQTSLVAQTCHMLFPAQTQGAAGQQQQGQQLRAARQSRPGRGPRQTGMRRGPSPPTCPPRVGPL
jgi:hypothetical protein